MSLPDFLFGWKIGGIALAILVSGATIGTAISNKKLEQHQIQTDSLLVEVRAQRRIGLGGGGFGAGGACQGECGESQNQERGSPAGHMSLRA